MTTDTRNLIWSPTGRLCYEHLEKATASSPHTRPKFSCGLVVKQTANLIPLRNAMLSALHRKGLPASLLDELMEEMRLDDDRAGRLDANAGDLLMTARCPSGRWWRETAPTVPNAACWFAPTPFIARRFAMSDLTW